MAVPRDFSFSIDRGGTFTDVFAETPKGPVIMNLLAVDKAHYPSAPREGVRRVLELVTGKPHPSGSPLDASYVSESVGMGWCANRTSSTAAFVRFAWAQLLRLTHSSKEKVPWVCGWVSCSPTLDYTGARCALVVTEGYRDLLFIGNQSRPKIFDLKVSEGL
jgi:5-oxoprolinase (ATP-hydrolysing)